MKHARVVTLTHPAEAPFPFPEEKKRIIYKEREGGGGGG